MSEGFGWAFCQGSTPKRPPEIPVDQASLSLLDILQLEYLDRKLAASQSEEIRRTYL